MSGQLHDPARIENEMPPARSLFVFINNGPTETSTHKNSQFLSRLGKSQLPDARIREENCVKGIEQERGDCFNMKERNDNRSDK